MISIPIVEEYGFSSLSIVISIVHVRCLGFYLLFYDLDMISIPILAFYICRLS